jgi:hypothetical protein
MPSMTQAEKRTVQRYRDMLDRIAKMAELTDEQIHRLLELSSDDLANRADGYPSGHVGGAADIDDPERGTELTAVESAAIRNLERGAPDPVRDNAHGALVAIRNMDLRAGLLRRRLAGVFKIGDAYVEMETDDRCQCCEDLINRKKGDRPRSGFCQACYRAWKRFCETNPSTADPKERRDRFVTERRAQLAA